MIDRLVFLAVLIAVGAALAAMLRRERQEGAAAERERIEAEAKAQTARRNGAAQRPMTDDELQKSLRDGSF